MPSPVLNRYLSGPQESDQIQKINCSFRLHVSCIKIFSIIIAPVVVVVVVVVVVAIVVIVVFVVVGSDGIIEKVSVGVVGSEGWIFSRQVNGTSLLLRLLIVSNAIGAVHST